MPYFRSPMDVSDVLLFRFTLETQTTKICSYLGHFLEIMCFAGNQVLGVKLEKKN